MCVVYLYNRKNVQYKTEFIPRYFYAAGTFESPLRRPYEFVTVERDSRPRTQVRSVSGAVGSIFTTPTSLNVLNAINNSSFRLCDATIPVHI